jgi:hypothetical protein
MMFQSGRQRFVSEVRDGSRHLLPNFANGAMAILSFDRRRSRQPSRELQSAALL